MNRLGHLKIALALTDATASIVRKDSYCPAWSYSADRTRYHMLWPEQMLQGGEHAKERQGNVQLTRQERYHVGLEVPLGFPGRKELAFAGEDYAETLYRE